MAAADGVAWRGAPSAEPASRADTHCWAVAESTSAARSAPATAPASTAPAASVLARMPMPAAPARTDPPTAPVQVRSAVLAAVVLTWRLGSPWAVGFVVDVPRVPRVVMRRLRTCFYLSRTFSRKTKPVLRVRLCATCSHVQGWGRAGLPQPHSQPLSSAFWPPAASIGFERTASSFPLTSTARIRLDTVVCGASVLERRHAAPGAERAAGCL